MYKLLTQHCVSEKIRSTIPLILSPNQVMHLTSSFLNLSILFTPHIFGTPINSMISGLYLSSSLITQVIRIIKYEGFIWFEIEWWKWMQTWYPVKSLPQKIPRTKAPEPKAPHQKATWDKNPSKQNVIDTNSPSKQFDPRTNLPSKHFAPETNLS